MPAKDNDVLRPLRALIVDDEPLARRAMARMLQAFPAVEVMGEAASVSDAAAALMSAGAEVVFLDIELFGESGFDLLPHLDETVAVVFVTAFDRYAIRAFKVNALDYLLKPVSPQRLGESIRRLREGLPSSRSRPSASGVLELDDVVLVQDGRGRRMVELARVCAIEASGDFTVVRTIDGQCGTMWRRMLEWEEMLPDDSFMRIHRSWIVNLSHVAVHEAAPGDRLLLHMNGMDKPCTTSRRLTPAVRKRLL